MKNVQYKIRLAIKLLAAGFLYYAGLLHIYRRIFVRDTILILMYHRVLPAEKWRNTFSSPGIIVTPETFEKQIDFLCKNYSLLDIQEYCQRIDDHEWTPGNACLITFDDGWHDNFKYAYPILQKFNAPCTIFLPTAYITGTSKFWQEKLARLIYVAFLNKNQTDSLLEKYCPTLRSAQNDSEAKAIISEHVRSLKGSNISIPLSAIHEIEQFITEHNIRDNNEDLDTYLTWDEVLEMHQNKIRFGSHSVNHFILPQLEHTQIERELAESKAEIETKLGAAIKTLAYPNGNYNENIIATAKKCGYKLAVTTREGLNKRHEEKLALKRINIHEGSTKYIPLFYCKILGIL